MIDLATKKYKNGDNNHVDYNKTIKFINLIYKAGYQQKLSTTLKPKTDLMVKRRGLSQTSSHTGISKSVAVDPIKIEEDPYGLDETLPKQEH